MDKGIRARCLRDLMVTQGAISVTWSAVDRSSIITMFPSREYSTCKTGIKLSSESLVARDNKNFFSHRGTEVDDSSFFNSLCLRASV